MFWFLICGMFMDLYFTIIIFNSVFLKEDIKERIVKNMCLSFTRQQLIEYIKTREWSVKPLTSRTSKTQHAHFIVNYNTYRVINNKECMVCCYNEYVHKCRRCTFYMCTMCEEKVHGLCPQCRCTLSNAYIDRFLIRQQHVSYKFHTRLGYCVFFVLFRWIVVLMCLEYTY